MWWVVFDRYGIVDWFDSYRMAYICAVCVRGWIEELTDWELDDELWLQGW